MLLSLRIDGNEAEMNDVPVDPEYAAVMSSLEAKRRVADVGSEYWFARDIMEVLGYVDWRNFEGAVERARSSLLSGGTEPSHHIVETNRLMRRSDGSQISVTDFFLSRGACYLVAMNADPKKKEVAAAQAYFAVRARQAEVRLQEAEDGKRLDLRDKIKESFKTVSGVAKEAGVGGQAQALFHDARYQGLYNMPRRQMMQRKGIGERENPFDRMGALELSANDFQMNLAAKVIKEEHVRGEAAAIKKNKEIAQRVRKTMIDSGSKAPEELTAEEPIKEVQKRVKKAEKRTPISR
jgi:DNA-damage-inducible protein D